MKIAVSGKGGVGKSTIAAALALHLARTGRKVLALDADPDANLASALGITHKAQLGIIPISEQVDMINQRTGASLNEYGRVFKLNPHVADIAQKYSYTHNGVSLIILGAVKTGGGGCACPESTFLRALVTDLVLFKDEALIMDMEAGIEHLGRATAQGVDVMLVVVEPGQRSIDCANSIIRMSRQIGIKRIAFVANKITSPSDEDFIRNALALHNQEILTFMPYSQALRGADRDGVSVIDELDDELTERFNELFTKIESK